MNLVSRQTGYVDSATSAGTGEDNRHVDVSITAVTDVDKCRVRVRGGAGSGTADAMNSGEHVSIRLTSTTNVRIATPASKSRIVARWTVEEWS